MIELKNKNPPLIYDSEKGLESLIEDTKKRFPDGLPLHIEYHAPLISLYVGVNWTHDIGDTYPVYAKQFAVETIGLIVKGNEDENQELYKIAKKIIQSYEEMESKKTIIKDRTYSRPKFFATCYLPEEFQIQFSSGYTQCPLKQEKIMEFNKFIQESFKKLEFEVYVVPAVNDTHFHVSDPYLGGGGCS